MQSSGRPVQRKRASKESEESEESKESRAGAAEAFESWIEVLRHHGDGGPDYKDHISGMGTRLSNTFSSGYLGTLGGVVPQ